MFTKNALLIKNFCFDPILTKLCEIVVLMSNTISQSFFKIGSKTKFFVKNVKKIIRHFYTPSIFTFMKSEDRGGIKMPYDFFVK